MARARTQRILAAAGLSLVTGTAAVGLAIVGVGPLGQVAASVRDTGVAVSRGVLSVVMPEDDPSADNKEGKPSTASTPRGQDAGQHGDTNPAEGAGTAPEPPEPDEPTGPTLPAAGNPDPSSVLGAMAEAFGAPSAQTSAAEDEPTGLVDGLLGGVLGQANNLGSGVLR